MNKIINFNIFINESKSYEELSLKEKYKFSDLINNSIYIIDEVIKYYYGNPYEDYYFEDDRLEIYIKNTYDSLEDVELVDTVMLEDIYDFLKRYKIQEKLLDKEQENTMKIIKYVGLNKKLENKYGYMFDMNDIGLM
ncbi:hypothetical protein M0Q50_00905 [bacterium]|jgi:hypothetical protein|nr:hypothetical protein [bacterium]